MLDFAVAQILRDDNALGALPAVLARLVDTFGLRAALAFQPSAAQPATVLAMHPRGAVDAALLAKIGALTLTQRDAAVAADDEGAPADEHAVFDYWGGFFGGRVVPGDRWVKLAVDEVS